MVVIKRDIIIAGAGPAGTICAAYLARAGFDVLLIDKDLFPRDKACGDMIREGIVRHIEKLEAVDVLDEKSTCIRKIRLVGGGGSEAVVPFECYALPRFELDKLLVDTAKSWGVEFRQGCRLIDVISENGKICGIIVRENGAEYEIRSRIIIGADGVDSQMVKCLAGISDAAASCIGEDENPDGIWLGVRGYFKGVRLDRNLTKDQYDAGGVFGFDGNEGLAYFWTLPVGRDGVKRGICNVGMLIKGRDACSSRELVARLEAWMGGENIKNMFDEAEQIGPWAIGRLVDSSQARKIVGEGYLIIGDAAAQIDPVFGAGLSAAADTAKAAADAVETALKTGDYSAEAIMSAYDVALAKLQPVKTEDQIKEDRLLMESLNDSHVMDKIIEMMKRDPNYAKKAL